MKVGCHFLVTWLYQSAWPCDGWYSYQDTTIACEYNTRASGRQYQLWSSSSSCFVNLTGLNFREGSQKLWNRVGRHGSHPKVPSGGSRLQWHGSGSVKLALHTTSCVERLHILLGLGSPLSVPRFWTIIQWKKIQISSKVSNRIFNMTIMATHMIFQYSAQSTCVTFYCTKLSVLQFHLIVIWLWGWAFLNSSFPPGLQHCSFHFDNHIFFSDWCEFYINFKKEHTATDVKAIATQ